MEAQGELKAGWGIWRWCAVLPLLYVLSIGPAARLMKGSPARFTMQLRAFYYPVIWLHDHTVLKKPLEVYVALWGVK
jgi:hypothetical protein